MAADKNSFIMYADLMQNIDHLTNEEKGQLFTHLLEYVNDLNPILEDRVLLSVWKPIERQLKRDLVKYSGVKEVRSLAGKRSAEIRAAKKAEQNSTNPTSVESVQQSSTNPTVSVNDNDTVNVNDNVILLEKETKDTAMPFIFFNFLWCQLNCDKQLLKDWLKVRAKKKAANTETAAKSFITQVQKSKLTADQILTECVERSWAGFKAEWLNKPEQPVAKRTGKDVFLETFYNTDE
jgi:hypothetical protein